MVEHVRVSVLDRQTHHELETWRMLLDRALSAIDAVERGSGVRQQIRIGGGTVLSALWGHRYSKDVDLFTRDPQVLGHLRPWLNDDVAAILGTNYEEGSNAIKFRLKAGSIDVVAAADILPDSAPTIESYRGRDVEIEDPAEIIAKKLFHRGDRGTVRDYVDLVEAFDRLPNLAVRLAMPLRGKIARATEVLTQMSEDRLAEQLGAVRFIGKPTDAAELRTRALSAMKAISEPDDPPTVAQQAAWLAAQRGNGR